MKLWVVLESTMLDFIETSILGVFDSKEKALQVMSERTELTEDDLESGEFYRDGFTFGTNDGTFIIRISECELNKADN